VAALGGTIEEEWCEIHVFDDGQAKTPRLSDVLQEAGGARWTIRKFPDALLGAMFVCTCQLER
jgi:hypothetical protein